MIAQQVIICNHTQNVLHKQPQSDCLSQGDIFAPSVLHQSDHIFLIIYMDLE